ncbi:MAG: hypothetical protein JEZ12_06345 [Desulfobacterium sp.]|nr:hypothetical protein [Desulfobacterium sp.]
MKYFPLKTVLLCLMLPPLLYAVLLSQFEKYLTPVYQQKIENHIIGDSESLLNGTVRIRDAVGNNIHSFLANDPFVKWFGPDFDIMVTTREGDVLYPSFGEIDPYMTEDEWDSVTISHQNYSIMNQGFSVKVITRLRHGTVGSNLVLILLIFIPLAIVLVFYRKGSAKALKEDNETGRRITELVEDRQAYEQIFKDLEKEKRNLFENIKYLRSANLEDKKKASIAEEDMFEEIVSLEQKLQENIDRQQEKESEIDELKEKLKKNERRKSSGPKRKTFDFSGKRFAALYKNLDMNRRALTGFLELKDDMQIKAEEIIHQLDADMTKVIVKRKVFAGKKNKSPSFEVLFGYNGRLYFRKTDNNRCEVLVVGTKNSQTKDMEYLHNL